MAYSNAVEFLISLSDRCLQTFLARGRDFFCDGFPTRGNSPLERHKLHRTCNPWTQAIWLDTSNYTDEQLANEAAREGSDGPAFRCLMKRFRQPVWRISYRLMGNETDAADAAQEVFVRLFLSRKKFEGRSKYSTWLHGIAIRTCLTLRRSRGRRQKHEIVDQEILSHRHPLKDANQTLPLDLMTMLDILNEKDRAMLILKYAESYSYDELAELFNLSVSGCKMRISRARKQIQKAFPENFS